MPNSPQFGGGLNQTVLHPAVLVGILLAMALIFILPRRFAVAPLLLMIFLIPGGQQIYVAGAHFYVIRVLILAAFIRAVISREPRQSSLLSGGWISIDTAVVCSVVIIAVATVMRNFGGPALVNQVGYLWDELLSYFALRSLIRDDRDAVLAIKSLAVLAVIFAATMIVEQKEMLNVFGLLGGVRSVPELRDGKIRSQAAFQHSLTAGAFAATAIPLFFILWKSDRSKWLSAIGIVGASVMVYTTQTSTSLLTAGAGILGICMWGLRRKMRMVRIGLVAFIVALAMVMKAPVWFIIAHIDLTGSSSNYQRAELIDQCVNHFSSWWLMGTDTAASWGWDMWDAQNMFVSVAEAGGLAALILFILVISRSFSRLGKARKRAESKREEWLFWFLGSALFANVVGFFGVNYFDQSRVAWLALLSIICACTSAALSRRAMGISAKVCVRVQVPGDESAKEQTPQTKPLVHWPQAHFLLDHE